MVTDVDACICIYICIYIYIYTYMCIYIYIYTYTCIYIKSYTCVHLYYIKCNYAQIRLCGALGVPGVCLFRYCVYYYYF